jgi:hypothetical protein
MRTEQDLEASIHRVLGDLTERAGPPEPYLERFGSANLVDLGSQRRPRLTAVALLTGAILAATAYAVIQRSTNRPHQQSPRVVPAPPPAADSVRWFLPASVPDGYVLADLVASRWDGTDSNLTIPTGPPERQLDFVRRTSDGRAVADRIRLITEPAPNPIPASDTTDTIHQLAASYYTTGQPMKIVWYEAGFTLTVSSDHLPFADIVRVAESTTVGVSGVQIADGRVPSGYVRIERSDVARSSSVVAEATSQRYESDNQSDAPLLVSSRTWFGSLDELDVANEEERRTVNGVDFSIGWSTEGGARNEVVTFVRDNAAFTVSGRLAIDRLIEVADSLRPVTPDEARTAFSSVVQRLSVLPALATGTLADGTALSVRGAFSTDTIPHAALCVENRTLRCMPALLWRDFSGSALAFDSIETDGRWQVVGWQEQPQKVSTQDGRRVEFAAGSQGRFFRLELGDRLRPTFETPTGGYGLGRQIRPWQTD